MEHQIKSCLCTCCFSSILWFEGVDYQKFSHIMILLLVDVAVQLQMVRKWQTSKVSCELQVKLMTFKIIYCTELIFSYHT